MLSLFRLQFCSKNHGTPVVRLAPQESCLTCTAKQYTGVPCFTSIPVVHLALQDSSLVCTARQYTGALYFISIVLCNTNRSSNKSIYCLLFVTYSLPFID